MLKVAGGVSGGNGTVTQVNTGTGLSGGPITTTGTVSLANTTVTAGTYGNSTSVAQVVINAQGQITSASNVAITISGQLTYAGAWNASTNTPTLTSSVGTLNNYYVVNVAGTTTLDGNSQWQVGDWAIFNGTVWERLDGGPYGTVSSVLTGTGLTGGPITTTGTVSLANTTVTAGSYGNASTVPNYTVNAQGQLTAAANTSISIAPSQINAAIPNSGLANSSITINGTAINLGGSGTVTANTTGTLTLGTGLSGTSFNGSSNVTAAIANTTVTAASYGSAAIVPTFTVNAQGQLTAAANATISIPASAINTTIPNSGLANSSITVNGTAINLGGSGTITANTTGTLTIGTGLTGGSFNGSSNATIALSTPVSVANGGTGVSTISAGSFVIGNGTNGVYTGGFAVNGSGALLILGSAGTSGQVLQSNGGSINSWLTLGTMASQNANNVTITGGSESNVTYSNANITSVAATFPNSYLANSSVTIGNTSVSLGSTQTTFGNVVLTNANITSVSATFPNSFLANSTTTLGNTVLTLGSTTTAVGNLTLNNVNVTSGNIASTTHNGFASAISTKTSAYTVTTTDSTILGNASSGAFSVTLPSASTATGYEYTIKKIDSSANNVTVATTSSQTIDGSTSYVLSLQYGAVTVQSNGTAWYIIGVTPARNGTAGTF